MKELSVEEKAKSYDEAIKYANYLINERCKEGTDGSFHRADLQKMFPELAESEDEKMRKAIHIYLDWLDGRKDYAPRGEYSIRDMISWLEKVGNIIKEWGDLKVRYIQDDLQEMVELKQKTEQGEQRPSGCPEYCVMSNCGNCPNQPIVVKQNPADVSKQEDIELTEFEDALYTTFSDIWQDYMLGKEINVVGFVREHSDELLKIANKQKPAEWSEDVEAAISLLKDIAEEQEKDYCPYNANDLRKAAQYLETCKPQNKWKPIEELLDVFIKNAIDFFESNFNPLTDGGVIGAFDDKEKMIEEFKEYMKEEGFNEEWI